MSNQAAMLGVIAEKARSRVAAARQLVPLDEMRKQARVLANVSGSGGNNTAAVVPFPFEQALRGPELSCIAEVKKASPSKGVIAADFPYLDIAGEYEAAGAAAVSVLTEPEYFQGSGQYLREIAAAVHIPVLRKDFIVDEYQIYEAKVWGAQAVLLICALLDSKTLAAYIQTAAELGLSALVEIHDEAEAEQALRAGARIIGINNRDLKTFTVDINTSIRLRKYIPAGIVTVTESGFNSPDDIRAVRGLGFNAVLIGEGLMRAPDKKQFLAELRQAAEIPVEAPNEN
jgi:indole-3-glycerol phosphate synthase